MSSPFVHPGHRADLKWLGWDLDGCLAEPLWTPDNPTSQIGAPRWENVEKARQAHEEGFKGIIHTARPSSDYEAIEAWASHHKIPIRRIITGKILVKAYIDDRAVHDSAPDWTSGAHCATCNCHERA